MCHCVSKDLNMGKGVATLFKEHFGGGEELAAQQKGIGEVAWILREARPIFYLITKARYFDKPTYGALKAALSEMKTVCLAQQVHVLAMPRIGCGLDGLLWSVVKEQLQDIFQDMSIQLLIFRI